MPQSKMKAARAENSLLAQRRAFERLRPQLLRRYEDQFVALHNGRVIDHDKSDEALAARMFAELGDAPFYIARVEATPSIYELPSPEVGR